MMPTSRAARVDLTMRASLYVLFGAVPLAVVGQVGGSLATVAAVLSAGQALAAGLLLHQSLDYRLGKGPKQRWRVVVAVVLTIAAVAVAGSDFSALTVIAPLCALLAALDPMVTTPAVLAIGLGGWLVAAGPAIYADGSAFAPHLALLLVPFAVLSTERWTVWTLDIVWQLDEAQHVKAELAVAEERLRFARDLHDVAGRSLSVVAIKAELAAQLGKRGRPEAVDEMLEVRRIAQDSLTELRAVVSGLRTARLDEELAGARSLLDAAGITCRVIGDGGGLDQRTGATLGWAIREATTNVLRHSKASSCTISLSQASSAVTLSVVNDGAPAARAAHGNGLTGLVERVTEAGGTVTAGPLEPDRFQVTVRLPISGEPATVRLPISGEPATVRLPISGEPATVRLPVSGEPA
ncbi:histidine kinase [Actinoplanes sp. OR16]|uniref:sensor histidine kinase n=1 Tax=Actinoplanes sp. OR16 TaxID=946334 RepID=UPI000F6F7258|nr:sensor histidine kinase [Actinoplanes sp. OR16]BBH70326.1 histidine kinase [Actinoplanes sp. OR16]